MVIPGVVIGRKSVLFREVNLAIAALLEAYESDDPAHFLCECEDETCTRRIELRRVEFEALVATNGRVVSPECGQADCSSIEK